MVAVLRRSNQEMSDGGTQSMLCILEAQAHGVMRTSLTLWWRDSSSVTGNARVERACSFSSGLNAKLKWKPVTALKNGGRRDSWVD